MLDGLFSTIALFTLVGVISILAGSLLGKYLYSRSDEASIRKGQCAECGAKSLRVEVVDEESFHSECLKCGAMWLVFVDVMLPVEQVRRQRVHVPALRFHIDADRPAFVFETDRCRASFPMDFFKHMPLYGAATPRDMLQVTHDNNVQPLDLWIDSTLLRDSDSDVFFEPLSDEEHAEWLHVFYDYVGVGANDPDFMREEV